MEDSDDENSTDDDESAVNENDAMEGDVEDETDSEVEDEDNAEESAIEKTRQAVRDALGVAGSVTDTVMSFLNFLVISRMRGNYFERLEIHALVFYETTFPYS